MLKIFKIRNTSGVTSHQICHENSLKIRYELEPSVKIRLDKQIHVKIVFDMQVHQQSDRLVKSNQIEYNMKICSKIWFEIGLELKFIKIEFSIISDTKSYLRKLAQHLTINFNSVQIKSGIQIHAKSDLNRNSLKLDLAREVTPNQIWHVNSLKICLEFSTRAKSNLT